MSRTIITLFGSTGDLAQHKLLPALFELSKNADSAHTFSIVAIGRRDYTTEQFLEQLPSSFVREGEDWQRFSALLTYYKMDIEDPGAYAGLSSFLNTLSEENRIFYLSVAPTAYASIIFSLKESGLHKDCENGWTRAVIEKPFGYDLVSAQELDRRVSEVFSEERIYRIDHYLGKETIQNILAFRFANRVFEPIWNRENIDHIQITVAEEEGIKNRGPYYDKSGAFRDIVQNHVLQLVAFLTLEEPTAFSFSELSDKKYAVLSRISPDLSRTVRGQYEGYRSEKAVDPESQTETYAMTCLQVDNDRWQGVPIYIRTGKNLGKRISEVSVQFKPSCQDLFTPQGEHSANVLTFRIQPDEGIALKLNVKTPRSKMGVQPVAMEFCYSTSFRMALPDAYERLFSDVLEGDHTYSIRADTIEASWKIIDPILAPETLQPVETYAPGTWGPERADAIMEADGRKWLAHESTVCNGISLVD